ncbi:MAG TPA: hypothetical protein V6D17_17300 [Candidatus Obscuribacterales bacterium]
MTRTQTYLDAACPNCAEPINAYIIRCPACSVDIRETYTPDPRSINWKDRSTFYYMSLPKLAVLSLVTFGFYNIFWFYKNWTYAKEHGQRKIMPFMRSLFSPFFFFSLIKEMGKAGAAQGVPCQLHAVWLAIAYFALVSLGRVNVFLGLLSWVPLLLVQKYVNTLNTDSPTPINGKFTIANWIFIVLGVGMTILAFFVPDTP